MKFNEMNDFAVDTETLGVRVNAALVSIGVQQFDRKLGKLGERFYVEINLASALRSGTVSAGTINFWLSQGQTAKDLFPSDQDEEAQAEKISLPEALVQLRDWISKRSSEPMMWANGTTFDIAKLEYQYDHGAVGLKEPWSFWAPQEMRSVRDLAELLGWKNDVQFNGTKHRADDDATWTALTIISIYRHCLAMRKSAGPAEQAHIVDNDF